MVCPIKGPFTDIGNREIIDESDVFIDVHKAIRRMAPAPKSRVPKGKIVEEPPMATSLTDGELDRTPTSSPVPTKGSSDLPRRRSSVEAPPPRFQLRRQNADQFSDPHDSWFTQRGATDEIREHLKHLGPSNLASRPRQTRYTSVKIKRNSTSPSHSAHTEFESGQSASDSQRLIPSTGLQGGIDAGLVSSGVDAKDGALALKIGYGTIATHDQVTKATNAQQYKDLPQVSIPEAVREEREDLNRSVSTQKSKSKSSSGTGSIRSTESRSTEFIYHHRGPTRSGSITEQIVDVNGVRKVVLHANCSSSSEGEAGVSPRHTGKSSPVTKESATHTTNTTDLQTSAPRSQTKKRRRKKKHGKHSKSTGADGAAEEQPLLH